MVLKKNTGCNAGFTLIELIVVIGILSIISSIAIPNIISWLPDYRLRSATRQIVSSLQAAKLRAAKENSRVVFDFLTETNGSYTGRYKAFVDNNPANWSHDNNEISVKQGIMHSGVDIQTAPSAPFGFNSKGLSESNGGLPNTTIKLKNNKSNYSRIIVNLPGRIRVQMSNDGINWN